MRHASMLLVLITVGFLAACKNANYCADNPNNDCRIAIADSGAAGCENDTACTDPTAPVCDLAGSKTCVSCTADKAGACVGETPVCGGDHACRACSAHADCPASQACLPDGSCANADSVAYVAGAPTGTDNTACTMSRPCLKLSAALATSKPLVKLRGAIDEQVSINNQNVTVLADPEAQLTSTKNGLLLEIKGTSQVAIYDLEITGASGPAGIGISLPPGNRVTLELHRARVTHNNAGGITANGGSIAISQSTISHNLGGGISITNGTFNIVGNGFVDNGGNNSLVGGIKIGIGSSSMNRLDFNTFALNTTQDGVGPAIDCVGMFTASNNILTNNRSTSKMDQTGGTCSHTFSIVHLGALPPGADNLTSDPLLVDPGKDDLHLQPTSPARHTADPAADLTGLAARDIDGDLRIAPADIGADQAK